VTVWFASSEQAARWQFMIRTRRGSLPGNLQPFGALELGIECPSWGSRPQLPSMRPSCRYFRFFEGLAWARSLPATLLTDLGVLGFRSKSLAFEASFLLVAMVSPLLMPQPMIYASSGELEASPSPQICH